MESNQYLAQERVGKLMAKYAVPCVISLLVGALYNIVDQIFIANATYLGSYGNAANTVVFPLTVVALVGAVGFILVEFFPGKLISIFGAASTILSLIREVVFGVGFALRLPLFFGLDGVLYSMPLSDVLTFCVAVYLIIETYRELRADGPALAQ